MTVPTDTARPATAEAAAAQLDEHFVSIVRHHFSPETGTPFWLNWAKSAGWDPATEVTGFGDLTRFPHFDGEWLRSTPLDQWIPRSFAGRPFTIFETGGTTGLPKQRIGWDDYKFDYEQFSDTLDDEAFPPGSFWLMVGPTGPRRLRLAIEHLANHRGSSCFFVDLDPRWVKKLIRTKQGDQAQAYMRHVVEQAVQLLKNRPIEVVFTTPKLLEALAEEMSLVEAGVKGVMCGGTTMTPQNVRFITEEVLEETIAFVPVYGNTLMGLSAFKPLEPEDEFSITYYPPVPRATLRITDPDDPDKLVDYDQWGRVELTTLTHEFFMPRFLERDEGLRRRPCALYPWDGVGDIRPFGASQEKIVEGVY